MSKNLRYDVLVSANLCVTVMKDDIINIKAGAVVTGEGPDLQEESFVTRALQKASPSLREIRRGARRKFQEIPLWTVLTSELGIPFKYVIHAILEPQLNNKWKGNMKTLYRRIFAAAEKLPIRAVAIPLLGAGAADTDTNLSIQAIAEAILKYSPKYINNIIIVNKNQVIAEMIVTQIQIEQSKIQSTKKGFLSKVRDKIDKTMCQVSDFFEPPVQDDIYRYNTDRRQYPSKDTGRINRHSDAYFEEERQLQLALELSRIEAARMEPTSGSRHDRRSTADGGPSSTLYSQSPAAKTMSCANTGVTEWNQSWNTSSDDSEDEDLTCQPLGGEVEVSVHSLSMSDCCNRRRSNDHQKDTTLTCPICLSVIMEPKQLHKCGHIFCVDCIERCFRDFKPVCPSCNMVYGVIIGNQPDGTMDVGFSDQSLPGYPGCGSITITYIIPSGTQQEGHPNPGEPFSGTTRHAYLPDCKEGKAILTLLRVAFDRKLTFTIGRSTTTGQEGVVTWNDIHHKTSISGGPTKFGYPDRTYLSRVRDELASKGVTDAIMSSP